MVPLARYRGLQFSLYSRSWHNIRVLPIRPYREHATTAAVLIGGATLTPAVVNLQRIVEYGYEYAYYFVESNTYLGMRVPRTRYKVHFFSYGAGSPALDY